MTVDVLPTAADLDKIAGQVWAAFLDDGSEVVVQGPTEDAEVAASVAIVGAYEGHVIVACTRDSARAVASALFAIADDDVTADDVSDALGELANVLGGNVKSILPGPSKMSLPTVAPTAHRQWPGTNEVCRTVLAWNGNTFTVSLLTGREIGEIAS